MYFNLKCSDKETVTFYFFQTVVWNVSGMVIMRPALCVNLVNMVQAVQNTAARTAKLTRRNVTGLATAFMAAILAGEEKDVMSKIVNLKIV